MLVEIREEHPSSSFLATRTITPDLASGPPALMESSANGKYPTTSFCCWFWIRRKCRVFPVWPSTGMNSQACRRPPNTSLSRTLCASGECELVMTEPITNGSRWRMMIFCQRLDWDDHYCGSSDRGGLCRKELPHGWKMTGSQTGRLA